MTDLELAAVTPVGAPEQVAPDRRRRAARGVMINSAFFVALGALNLLRAVIVAGLLTPAEFGVWTILFLTIAFLGAIKAVTVSDKYIQQEEPDQELAFQRAFTLELLTAGAMTALMVVLAPVLALAYGLDELLLPGVALALMLPGLALQAPIWVFYRRMDFFRQRLLLAVDPLVGFVATVSLAAAGLGYWSLVIGTVAGAWSGGLIAMSVSPYRPALRFARDTLRSYVSFSWPLVTAVLATLAIAQLSVYLADLSLGLIGAAAIGLAASFSVYTDKVDALITAALYPAVCRVQDRRDLLLEAFTKSNRLALMWGVPFGVALTLFAADLIEFGIGEEWSEALVLLQVFGVVAAVNHIGFNWTAFYRARGETRPLAVVALLSLAAFLAAAVPLLFAFGLDGFAAGIAVMTAVSLGARYVYLSRLFPSFVVVSHSLRAILPTLLAAGAVLIMRALGGGGERSGGDVVFELAVFCSLVALFTVILERSLLREALSYVRRTSPAEETTAQVAGA